MGTPRKEKAFGRTESVYDMVERVVSGVLLMGMVAVVFLATGAFFYTLVTQFFADGVTVDYSRFQVLFDRVLAAVIALELARSIRQMVAGEHGLNQLRTVIVIGMLAVVRKLIVLEVESTTGGFLAGIAAAVAALSAGLVAINWVEARETRAAKGEGG